MPVSGLGAKLSPVRFSAPPPSAPSVENDGTTGHWHTSYFHGAFAGNEAEGRARYPAQITQKILMRSSGRHRCSKIRRDQDHQELSNNMAVNGSGLSHDPSQPEEPSPTTPFAHQYPPHPVLLQNVRKYLLPFFQAPGNGGRLASHHRSVSLPWVCWFLPLGCSFPSVK